MYQNTKWLQVKDASQSLLFQQGTVGDVRSVRLTFQDPSLGLQILCYNSSLFQAVAEAQNVDRETKRTREVQFNRQHTPFLMDLDLSQTARKALSEKGQDEAHETLLNLTNFTKVFPMDHFYLGMLTLAGKKRVPVKDVLELIPLVLALQGDGAKLDTAGYKDDMTEAQSNWKNISTIPLDKLRAVLQKFDVDKSKLRLVNDVASKFPIRM
ncbi:unnamed protein product [Caenorhabditis sp. 36 PRJEB53466]|nr:unnamed protein product [Caenorhabditis sp. 36 PRJEB53466]